MNRPLPPSRLSVERDPGRSWDALAAAFMSLTLIALWASGVAKVNLDAPDGPAPPPEPGRLSAPEEELYDAHSAERSKVRLHPLQPDPVLMQAAREHAAWMAANRRLDHQGEHGDWHMHRLWKLGFEGGWDDCSENVAEGAKDGRQAVSDWMTSPGHAANVVGRRWTKAGFGMAADRSGRRYWCAVYAR